MTRRIVCWLTPDPCSLVAAKLAIRENEQHGLPLVVVSERTWIFRDLTSAVRYLGVPVVVVLPHERTLYCRLNDVHVFGIPVDEQSRYDSLVSGVPKILEVLADRALTRADCLELLRRANVDQTVTFRARPKYAGMRAFA